MCDWQTSGQVQLEFRNVSFWRGRKNQSTWRKKTLRARTRTNNKLNPTNSTLPVGGRHSHHCAIPAPHMMSVSSHLKFGSQCQEWKLVTHLLAQESVKSFWQLQIVQLLVQFWRSLAKMASTVQIKYLPKYSETLLKKLCCKLSLELTNLKNVGSLFWSLRHCRGN